MGQGIEIVEGQPSDLGFHRTSFGLEAGHLFGAKPLGGDALVAHGLFLVGLAIVHMQLVPVVGVAGQARGVGGRLSRAASSARLLSSRATSVEPAPEDNGQASAPSDRAAAKSRC